LRWRPCVGGAGGAALGRGGGAGCGGVRLGGGAEERRRRPVVGDRLRAASGALEAARGFEIGMAEDRRRAGARAANRVLELDQRAGIVTLRLLHAAEAVVGDGI